MPLLDHFHPPLHGPRRWEGFHHAWATTLAQQLNRDVLPPNWFAEPEIIVGIEIEVRVYQELDGAQLRGAIELVSPSNKDRPGSRLTFVAKCAGYLRQGIGVVMVDVVTSRAANLHGELFEVLEAKTRKRSWESATGLCAVAYRAVTVRKSPRVEVWPETLTLGATLPTLPLWLSSDLCVPVRLEDSYLTTCRSLRISA